jgi:hypothetical protein
VTNPQIRSWYLSEVSKIAELSEEWVRRGEALEQRARRSWQPRHDLRLKAREMMANPLDVEDVRERDRKKYSHLDGPTFEYLLDRARTKGLRDDEAYRSILIGAQSTSEEFNMLLRLSEEPNG